VAVPFGWVAKISNAGCPQASGCEGSFWPVSGFETPTFDRERVPDTGFSDSYLSPEVQQSVGV
jgi:hypothetical protein